MVSLLIQFGASVNHVDNNGETALFLNAVYGIRDNYKSSIFQTNQSFPYSENFKR